MCGHFTVPAVSGDQNRGDIMTTQKEIVYQQTRENPKTGFNDMVWSYEKNVSGWKFTGITCPIIPKNLEGSGLC